MNADEPLRLACFLPLRVSEARPVTAEEPGFIPEWGWSGLMDLLAEQLPRDLPGVELVDTQLDFRCGIVVNGELLLRREGEVVNLNREIDSYVWYAKIAKLPYHVDLDKLRALSDGPVVVNPPEGYATTLDKLTAHRTLRRHSLPAADDFAFDVTDPAEVDLAAELLLAGGEVVIKPRLGSFGLGILTLHDHRELLRLHELLRHAGRDFAVAGARVLAELPAGDFDEADLWSLATFEVPATSRAALFGEIKYRLEPADWLGITVIGGRAVYGYRKQPQTFRDGWRVWDSSGVGGHVDYVPLTAPLRQLAERAAAALGMAIVGFDLVRTAGGWRIIDENAFPGLYRHCFTGAATTLEAEFYRVVCQAAGAAAGRQT